MGSTTFNAKSCHVILLTFFSNRFSWLNYTQDLILRMHLWIPHRNLIVQVMGLKGIISIHNFHNALSFVPTGEHTQPDIPHGKKASYKKGWEALCIQEIKHYYLPQSQLYIKPSCKVPWQIICRLFDYLQENRNLGLSNKGHLWSQFGACWTVERKFQKGKFRLTNLVISKTI